MAEIFGRHVGFALSLPVVLVAALAGSVGTAIEPAQPKPTSSPSQVPSPTPTPTPTPSAAAKATAIHINASAVDVLSSDGRVVASLALNSDVKRAVTELTAALGAPPSVTQTTPDHCTASYTVESWGDGLSIWHGADYPLPKGLSFGVGSTASKVQGVRVETPQGVAVGDLAAALITATPAANIEEAEHTDGTWTSIWYDLVPVADGDYGAFALAKPDPGGDRIHSISSPVFRHGEC